jgi:putative flippase GtrA
VKNYLKSFATAEALRQFMKVAAIGVINTVSFFVIFNILRGTTDMSRPVAVSVAFAAATLISYTLNRRWTFDLKDGHVVFRETVTFYVVNLVAWGVTVAVVEGSDWLFGPLTRLGENVALVFASGLILLPKFASYRDVVFRKALNDRDATSARSEPSVLGE